MGAQGGEVGLHVEIDGEGPCVVLGHGFGGSARNFRSQVRALRDRYRCVVFDARGHARSGAPREAGAYTLEALASDLERVLDRAGAERACVVGLSLGAAVALHFALLRPERVDSLVLASYPGVGGGPWARRFADAIDASGLEAAGARFVWGPDSGLDSRGATWVKQGFLEHPPHALAHLLRGVLGALPSMDALGPTLVALDRPVLLVAGSRDSGSVSACRALAAALPRARLEEIEDAGHVVNLERPREFAALLLDFLDAPDRAGLPPQPAPSSRRRRNG